MDAGAQRQSEGQVRSLTQLYQRELDSVNTLYDAGARLFRLTDENRPAESRGFYGRQLSLDDLLEHLERRGRLGIEPRSIGAVVVDVDDGNVDHFIQTFRPMSVYQSRTPGRVHAYYRHVGEKVSPRPFNAPLFRISGDLKHARSYVALYDTKRLADDLTNGQLAVPFAEVEQALVTGPLAVQGGQRGPLTPPVGSDASPDDSTPSPGHHRHTWILGKLTAARVDGMQGKELRRYAHKLHTGLVQTPGLVPHFFELAEAIAIADYVSSRSYSTEHQRSAGIRSGQARRARSAARDTHILSLLDKGHSIRRIAEDIEVSRRTVARVKDRQRARALR